jgi:hypothetical protein
MPVIDKIREENPNWSSVDPYEVGKKFGADYVIDVEITDMDLYKPGSRNQFLLGHANVYVNAYDLSKVLTEPAYRQDFVIQYPQSEREVESRAQVSSFRMAFVQRIASDISVKFVATSPQKLHRVD